MDDVLESAEIVMLAIIFDPFFVFGFLAGIVLSFVTGLWIYEKVLRRKLENVVKVYKQNLSNLQNEIKDLAEHKKSDMQDIVNQLQDMYETQHVEIKLKEEKLINAVKNLDELYSNIANESENIKSNINELYRLREKNEKLVATNRQLNERLTKKKRQLQNLKGGKQGEN